MRQTDPSPRVRLEVAFLDADQAAPAPAQSSSADERACLTVLVVAAEPDLRRYVRECLRERTDLRVIEAASVAAALAVAARHRPELLVVDEPERAVLAAGSPFRAILLVDDVPHGASSADTRLRLLARPFTAEELVAEVARMIG